MKDILVDFLRAINIDNYQSIRQSNIGDSLSYADIIQLSIINQNTDITIGELGKALNLSKPATTQKVNELVSKGLIEKVPSIEDKRVVYLRPTSILTNTCERTGIEDLISQVESNFCEEEKQSFYKVIEFMTKYLKDDRSKASGNIT